MHWEVQLTGDKTDLRMLADRLAAEDIAVAESRGEFVLRAVGLESMHEAGAVRSRAVELVRAMSASARLAFGTATGIGLGAVYRVADDGRRDITVFLEPGIAHARTLPVTLAITRRDGTSEVHRPADPVARWVPLASKDPTVARALRLRDVAPLEWVDLYRLYEVIQGDVGAKTHKLGWATREECCRFTRTANSVAAAGDKARHGRERTAPPPEPMSLSAARKLIDRLLHAWLDWKAGGGDQSPG
jgi:hypothetical protein